MLFHNQMPISSDLGVRWFDTALAPNARHPTARLAASDCSLTTERQSAINTPSRMGGCVTTRSGGCVTTRSGGCVTTRSGGCVTTRSGGCVTTRSGGCVTTRKRRLCHHPEAEVVSPPGSGGCVTTRKRRLCHHPEAEVVSPDHDTVLRTQYCVLNRLATTRIQTHLKIRVNPWLTFSSILFP
jgi:hypothetical protein